MGMVCYNYGVNSSSIANVAGWNGMCTRYDSMPDDADIITIMGGLNDLNLNVPLGTFGSQDDTTFYGALYTLFNGLYNKYFATPSDDYKKKIIVITPLKALNIEASTGSGVGVLKDLAPYVNAIKEVASYFSFPVLDLYNISNLNPHLDRTLTGTDVSGFFNQYMPDGTHPTRLGQQMIADIFEGFLNSLV